MTNDLKELQKARRKVWAAALRSGDYKQGHTALRTSSGGFCCLGVACDLFNKDRMSQGEEDRWGTNGSGGWIFKSRDKQDREFGSTDFFGVTSKEVRDYFGITGGTGFTHGGKTLASLNDGGLSFEEIADIIESYALQVQ